MTLSPNDIAAWARKCRNKAKIDAMLAMASRDPRIIVSASRLDRNPLLLGVDSGVVDLNTGRPRVNAKKDYVTKYSPVAFDPKAQAPRWCRFIAEITGSSLPVEYDDEGRLRPESVGTYRPRPQLAGYLQRLCGYCCTGLTTQQKMFICIGSGANGKNVLLDIVQEILGDYCMTIPPEALMATRHDSDPERPTPVTASLAGTRLAISSESRDGQRLDVALIKRHTGGGFMTARGLHQNTFRFEITHKLMLMTNSKPSLDHLDDAVRGRLHLIPFDRIWNRPGHTERNETLPDGDPNLMKALRAEAPGILAWLVEGAVAFMREGLEPPPEVLRMTQNYLAEQDPITRWLETMERCDPRKGTGASELWKDFEQWKLNDDGGGAGPASQKAFSITLEKRGFAKVKTKTANKFGLTRR
jgi:P4 family phage/plasmid primase-like protien